MHMRPKPCCTKQTFVYFTAAAFTPGTNTARSKPYDTLLAEKSPPPRYLNPSPNIPLPPPPRAFVQPPSARPRADTHVHRRLPLDRWIHSAHHGRRGRRPAYPLRRPGPLPYHRPAARQLTLAHLPWRRLLHQYLLLAHPGPCLHPSWSGIVCATGRFAQLALLLGR